MVLRSISEELYNQLAIDQGTASALLVQLLDESARCVQQVDALLLVVELEGGDCSVPGLQDRQELLDGGFKLQHCFTDYVLGFVFLFVRTNISTSVSHTQANGC